MLVSYNCLQHETVLPRGINLSNYVRWFYYQTHSGTILKIFILSDFHPDILIEAICINKYQDVCSTLTTVALILLPAILAHPSDQIVKWKIFFQPPPILNGFKLHDTKRSFGHLGITVYTFDRIGLKAKISKGLPEFEFREFDINFLSLITKGFPLVR